MSIVQTFCTDLEMYQKLEDLKQEAKISRSKLIQIFIKYFSKNPDILNDLIKENGELKCRIK